MSGGLLSTLAQKAAPGRAALLVIDVQNDFCADGGFFHQAGADVAAARQAVPPLAGLLDAARAAGLLVVFVQAIYDDEYLSPAMRERNQRRGLPMPRCLTGSWGADFFEVRPAPDEPVVVKHRYSAMQGTGLHALLRARGIESLLLTGVATDTCVESTGRDAYFMDYYVTLVADCCGAASPADHDGALRRFDRDYGAVCTAADLIAIWHGDA
jgi:ureidoacrylate peracid hydrolase